MNQRAGFLSVLGLIIIAILVLSAVGTTKIARADSPTYEPPPCAQGEQAVPDPEGGYTYVQASSTCGFFTETFTISNLNVLSNVAYIYRDDSGYLEGDTISVVASTSINLETNPYKQNWDYFGYSKNQLRLQSYGEQIDPMSIFTTSSLSELWPDESTHNYSEPFLTSDVGNWEGVMFFVVPQDDDALGLSSLLANSNIQTSTYPVIDGKFVYLDSNGVSPYVVEPITSPIKEVDYTYSPLGTYGGNKIVLYKSKAIQKLDDGSQNVLTFNPPQIAGVIPLGTSAALVSTPGQGSIQTTALATNQTSSSVADVAATDTPVQVIQAPWWAQWWCSLTRIFGSSC
jgi:hypothetical protein